MIRKLFLVFALYLVIFSKAHAAGAAAEVAASDSPRRTAAGTMFTLPAGWGLTASGARRLLDGPEKDFHIVFVDVAAAADADEALKRAWQVHDPRFTRRVEQAQDFPGREGWEARRTYIYETSPNENRYLVGRVFRHGTSWTVALLDGTVAARERRAAQINQIFDTLHPAGYAPESFAGKTPHRLDAEHIKLLTDYIERIRKAADIPGAALGLIQDGKVVFAGGFGVRELGKPTPVDADSLFIIASNTKPLTSLLMARAIDAGKFGWDTPAVKLYPDFKLGDAETTSHVLMRHLVCACTGLPRQDLEWLFEFKNATPESELRLIGTFKPTTRFGESFQYSNPLVAAAGFITGHVLEPRRELGAAYDEAMRQQVFTPLGMKATTLDFARALKANHATPHDDDIDGHTLVASMGINYGIIPLRPAGGIWSSVNDLLRYVQMELAGGRLPDGTRFVSAENLVARQRPQVTVGQFLTYGSALMVQHKWGVVRVDHGGDLPGYHSDMMWFPELGVGAVILTNSELGAILRSSLSRRLLEVLFDGHPEAEDDALAAIARNKKGQKEERARLAVPARAAELAAHYVNASLGDITVRHRGAATVFDFSEWSSTVASRQNDDGTRSFVTIDPGVSGLLFVAGERDGKRTLISRDGQHEYVFLETR